MIITCSVKELVLGLFNSYLSLLFYILILLLRIVLRLFNNLVLAQKPFFSRDLNFSLFLIFISFGSIFGVKIFFPNIEVLHSDRSESCELGPFKHFLGLLRHILLNFKGPPFDQILMDPASCLLYNIKNNRLLVAISNYFINLLDDVIDIVSSQACDRLDFVA